MLRYEMCNWRGKMIVNFCETTSSGKFYYCNIHFTQHNITSAWLRLYKSYQGKTYQ